MAAIKSLKLKYIIWPGVILALLLVVAVGIIPMVVPAYVESKLIPDLAQKFGLKASQVNIQHIGWFGADLGPIDIDGDGAPVVRIATVKIDYSPITLLGGNLKTITMGGVRLVVTATPEGFSIPGLKIPPGKKTDKTPSTRPDLKNIIPVGVEQIHLSQWEVEVLWKGRRVSTAMDITLTCGALSKGRLTGSADIAIQDSTLALAFSLDQDANSATLIINNGDLELSSLSQLIDLTPDTTAEASAALKGSSSFQLMPFELTGLSFSGHLTGANFTWPIGSIQNVPAADSGGQPITFAIEASGPDRIIWRGGPLLIQAPVKAQIMDVHGDWAPSQGGWAFNAGIKAMVPAQSVDTLALTKNLPITWQAKVQQSKGGEIEFSAQTTTTHPLAMEMAALKLDCPTYQLKAEGRLNGHGLSAKSALVAGKIHLVLPDGRVGVSDITINSTLLLNPPDDPSPSEIKTDVVLDDIRATHLSTQLIAPRTVITATGKKHQKAPWQYQAIVKVADAHLTDPSRKIDLNRIDIDLPLQWPIVSDAEAGRLKVRTIQWDRRHLGNLEGSLRQKKGALALSLRHDSKLFPKLRVLINGSIKKAGGSLSVKLPAYQFPEEVDLGRFFPGAAGVWVNGQIEASAKLTMDNKKLIGSASFLAEKGSLREEQRQIALDGIHAAVHLDDLMALKSAPHQKLHVGHLAYGKLMAEDLEVDFQIKDRKTLLVEKTLIQWCNGRLSATALQLSTDKKNYSVTLYCEQLNLAMVLEQLGAAQASGEGTVNGEIPMHWHDGTLRFDKGFLYSPPGQQGVIHLTGTDALLSGLPPNTPQHVQVDIATEALKDYTYNWAKLNVESQGENLLLKLQFDGKPNRLLPFAFDQQLGQLKRVAGEGQAEFKGIGIDLNFTSPLDKILHYKELLTPNQ